MNLLITGAFAIANEERRQLEDRGHCVAFLQQEKDPLPCPAAWVEGIIGNGIFLHHPIESFSSLRFIQLTSAGFDRVPLDYIKEHNIALHNAKGVYSIPMAEFAVWGVLSLYKQGRFFHQNQTRHQWVKHRGLKELTGSRVCVVGCGSVGTACAERFRGLGCTVCGVDVAPYDSPLFEEMLPLAALDKQLAAGDIVVLTLPLTADTRHLMNAARLAQMKPGSVLVNLARGGIVDTFALQKALENHLFGAVLDVFEEEPLPETHPLWEMENVIVTPHNSFVGDGNRTRLWNVIQEHLQEA